LENSETVLVNMSFSFVHLLMLMAT